ncbi:MAG: sulfur carrier protein ThiS [Hyphomicrobium zavarzinii]|uniref:sulfur carrier protein ThiS n=1 Tax=Hyphomicrobium zavarzinii TaxID=48292 RepID=UPI001A3E326E|nr:sulfur carrier protein ThiS [Hyphomicrobium zavarzinii]
MNAHKPDDRGAIAAANRLREVTLNGRPLSTGAETLADLVAEQGFGDVKVATAVNGDFVAARLRESAPLRNGDRVEILSVRQGG